MKYIKIVLFISLSVVSTFALADNMLRVAVVGGGLNGALGNYTSTNNGPHSEYLSHDGNHYINYHPEYKKHKKLKRYSPRLANLEIFKGQQKQDNSSGYYPIIAFKIQWR